MRIIGLAPNGWHGLWVNRQQLLSRLGGRHAVVYSNGAWFTWDRGRAEWRDAGFRGGFEHADGVWVDRPPRMLMRNPRLPAADRLVMRAQAGRWVRHVSRHGSGPLVLHVFHPAYADYLHVVRHDVLVYHPYDWFERMPGWSERYEAGERVLLQRASVVIAPSDVLAGKLAGKYPREVRVLNNGVDVAAFDQALRARTAVPADLAAIPEPRLGYIGSLQPHIDFPLIARLARLRPDWQFPLVGISTAMAEGASYDGLAECAQLPNVHFLGNKSRVDVPRYAAHLNVSLIPWRLGNGWVDANYPLKLHEYLAAGAPVVSADLHCVRALSDIVRIVRDADDWEAAIREALATGGPGTAAARRRIAAQNGWDQRAGVLESWLHDATARAA